MSVTDGRLRVRKKLGSFIADIEWRRLFEKECITKKEGGIYINEKEVSINT